MKENDEKSSASGNCCSVRQCTGSFPAYPPRKDKVGEGGDEKKRQSSLLLQAAAYESATEMNLCNGA